MVLSYITVRHSLSPSVCCNVLTHIFHPKRIGCLPQTTFKQCTAVAKSIGSNIHFVIAKLAGPWHKMTANIISVNHIISQGKVWNSSSQVKSLSFWLDLKSRLTAVKNYLNKKCLPQKSIIKYEMYVFQYSIETLKHFPQILSQQTFQNTFVIAKTYGHDCTCKQNRDAWCSVCILDK